MTSWPGCSPIAALAISARGIRARTRPLRLDLGLARLGLAPAQQQVQRDRAEGRGADAAERETAEAQREVTGAEHQRDGGDDQVGVVAEVDLVVDPDLRSGDRDQAEHDDADAA